MGEHLWFLGGLLLALLGYLRSRRVPPPPLTPLEQATLRSMANRLSRARTRMAELIQENEALAGEVARLGRLKEKAQLEVEELKDQQLAERDELIQRLASCTCGVGRAIGLEMEEEERG